MVYVDTSVLIAAHTREPHTHLAQTWLSGQGAGLLLGTWTWLECESALAIKCRRGELNEVSQQSAGRDIAEFIGHYASANYAPLVVPSEADFQRARELVRQAGSGLRAGDALHLAVALRLGANRLATLDRVLANNAARHGLAMAIELPG